MHLQAAVDGFDMFARSLSVGAETMVMRFERTGRCTTATRSSATSSTRTPGARS